MGKLLPLLLIVFGAGAGIGAGLFLRPEPELDEVAEEVRTRPAPPPGEALATFEFSNQFMVPLLVDDRLVSVVVLRLALEIVENQQPLIETNSARLRDAMLQVMFDHANSGGFSGVFTEHTNLTHLRRSLLEAAQKTVGQQNVYRVLITDLQRSGV